MYLTKPLSVVLVALTAMSYSTTASPVASADGAQEMNAQAVNQVDRAVMNQLIRYYSFQNRSGGFFGSLGDAIGNIIGSVGDLGKGIIGGVGNVGLKVLNGASDVTKEALHGVGNIGDAVLDDAGHLVHNILH
ncbi:hypothetical protein H4219_004737 [Mycoemilia scoparia]|uniref:Secreted protein n=1 Tax=Mycoemilia scoparia TaxID=417184 RepID=A0A9W8DQM9_9FUNG|nr:hypothetical protein H4219_004737 [Mycoemilia scoparia]